MCVCVCLCVRVRLNVCMHELMSVFMRACMHVSMRACMYACVLFLCAGVRVYACVCAYKCAHVSLRTTFVTFVVIPFTNIQRQGPIPTGGGGGSGGGNNCSGCIRLTPAVPRCSFIFAQQPDPPACVCVCVYVCMCVCVNVRACAREFVSLLACVCLCKTVSE